MHLNSSNWILATIAILFSGLCPAHGSTLTDPLDTWNLTAGHSPELLFDADTGARFFGDHSRVKCTGGTASTFFYHLSDVNSFVIFCYFWNNQGQLAAYTSADGNNWAPISLTYDTPHQTVDGSPDWQGVRAAPASALPAGTNYVAFTLKPDQVNFFTPQIGQVAIRYGEADPIMDSGPGPSGLIVTTSGSDAHLDWYPIKGAKSYVIERRTAKADEADNRRAKVVDADFHKIATGVVGDNYVDSGLKPGVKYYYVVKAVVNGHVTGPSEQVLASSTPENAVFVDPLTDLNLVVKHSNSLAAGELFGAEAIHRLTANDEFVEYKLTGASSFAINVYTTDDNPSTSISAQTSADDINWNDADVSFKLTAAIGDKWYGSVCTPSSKLPDGTNFVRFKLSGPSTSASPMIAQVRLISPSQVAASR